MSCTNILVRVHGLDDECSDLVIEGSCGDCGGQLWQTRYSAEKCLKMTQLEMHSMTARDVKSHYSHAERHTCREH